jgi:hypothetical protein
MLCLWASLELAGLMLCYACTRARAPRLAHTDQIPKLDEARYYPPGL